MALQLILLGSCTICIQCPSPCPGRGEDGVCGWLPLLNMAWRSQVLSQIHTSSAVCPSIGCTPQTELNWELLGLCGRELSRQSCPSSHTALCQSGSLGASRVIHPSRQGLWGNLTLFGLISLINESWMLFLDTGLSIEWRSLWKGSLILENSYDTVKFANKIKSSANFPRSTSLLEAWLSLLSAFLGSRDYVMCINAKWKW